MPPGTRIEEAAVFGRGTWVVAGAVAVACLALVGPSTPGDGVFARSLPADAVKKVHPGRVMTWNICNPCDESNVDRAAEIAAVAPQVIGLQEACVRDVERIREYLETFHGLVYHVEYGSVLGSWSRCGGAPWKPGGFGQAILSAGPLTDRVGAEYPEGGSEDRGYMAVTATVGGQPVRIFNTHLAQRRQEAIRADQVDVLAEEVARHDRAIVVGDFNAVPDSAELAPMWKVAKDADTACRPPSEGACGLTTDWQSKFDYVFLRGVSPLAQRVRLSESSDHNLVYADVDLT